METHKEADFDIDIGGTAGAAAVGSLVWFWFTVQHFAHGYLLAGVVHAHDVNDPPAANTEAPHVAKSESGLA